jgi:hypothetical protein
MVNYTERLVVLMHDIVARVPALSFINISEVLVFARHGRSDADGAYATCHSLNLPTSEPGYYFWRDRRTGRVTRRSEWFVTKTPEVRLGPRRIKYLISFVLPRFCDQTLERSRKKDLYRGHDPWIAKLDTVVHELYHIDPLDSGIRRVVRPDGTHSERSHSPTFYTEVAAMVHAYLDSRPDPACYDVLRHDFATLNAQFGGVVGTTFRNFPSFPQRYIEALSAQPDTPAGRIETLKPSSQPAVYTEDDLHIHHFLQTGARRVTRKGQHRAA